MMRHWCIHANAQCTEVMGRVGQQEGSRSAAEMSVSDEKYFEAWVGQTVVLAYYKEHAN